MKMRRHITFLVLAVVALMAGAATVENEYFAFSTPDDSWFLTNDDALRPYGARVDVSRNDARGATLELARIDYIEGAFDPQLYLSNQVLQKKDVFCRAATNFSEIYDYYLTGFAAQCVQFKKTSNNYNYDCEAVAFNVGYGTCLVIMAHRADQPSLIGRLVSAIRFKVDTNAITTAAAYVAAANQVVKRHHLPIGNNEHLSGVEISPDSSTVTLTVTVPYITRENVNVPAFVMTKRDAWFKQAPEALRFNLLLSSITRERKNLRYFYADTKGKEIGTLLILPEEYEQVVVKPFLQEEDNRQETPASQNISDNSKEAPEPKPAVLPQEPAPKPTTITHEVKTGDNLTKIAKRYGVTVSDIKNANPTININQIKIGQKLVIPQR